MAPMQGLRVNTTPIYYFSFWVAVIALLIVAFCLYYGITKGWNSSIWWTLAIAGVILLIALWWLTLNYVNNALMIHNQVRNATQATVKS